MTRRRRGERHRHSLPLLARSERARSWDWLRTQRELTRIFGRGLYEPLWRLLEAYAELQLLDIHSEVRAAVEETVGYVHRLAKSRTSTIKDEWPEVRAHLLQAIAETGDAPALKLAKRSQIVAGGIRAA